MRDIRNEIKEHNEWCLAYNSLTYNGISGYDTGMVFWAMCECGRMFDADWCKKKSNYPTGLTRTHCAKCAWKQRKSREVSA